MKEINLLFFIIITALLSGCGGGADSSQDTDLYQYQQPSSSICDVSANFSDGYLCAVRPSRLDASARDVYGNSSADDLAFGFGYHVIAFPKDGTVIRGVYIHLTGSHGRPYNQDTISLANKTFMEESFNSGYIMIQPAYNNRFAVNSADECGSTNVGVDNCAGDVRLEKITGADASSINVTPVADSIEHRIVVLVQYLETQGFNLPTNVVVNGNIDWSSVRVGGHSQGAGHALYITKYLNGNYACMLAGGYDVYDTVPSIPSENIADWILDSSVAFDVSKLHGLLSVDDENYSYFSAAYGVLNLVEDIHWRSIDASPYSNKNGDVISGHSAPLQDPRFSSLRYEACFGN